MLKFEGKFKIGDKIKSYDFPPMPDRESSWLEGTIIDDFNTEHGFNSFKVVITKRIFSGTTDSEEIGDFAWVPHQVSFLEYDERIQLL